MAVDITGGPNFTRGAPRALFATGFPSALPNTWFDVNKDGRFLIPTQVEQPSANVAMTVIVNWTEELKR